MNLYYFAYAKDAVVMLIISLVHFYCTDLL